MAAGLGDVKGVAEFIDKNGRPTAAAHRDRPDLDALGFGRHTTHPGGQDDEVLMEAFEIAMWNGRTAVLEAMVASGFNVNSLAFGSPAISLAVGNAWEPVVETLIRCGADLDLDGVGPGTQESARKTARWMLLHSVPVTDVNRRIARLCGLDPDAIIAEHAAAPAKEPEFDPRLEEWLRHAGDDAFRLNQPEITPENLLIALLRFGATQTFTMHMSLDVQERFYSDLKSRLAPGDDPVERPKIPLSGATQQIIQLAISDAKERRREWVGVQGLEFALLHDVEGPAAALLQRYGLDINVVRAEMEQWL
jgi:hypothetical protein